jgi:hypothetical protein
MLYVLLYSVSIIGACKISCEQHYCYFDIHLVTFLVMCNDSVTLDNKKQTTLMEPLNLKFGGGRAAGLLSVAVVVEKCRNFFAKLL